jgi:hypothetical protein
LEQAQRRIGDIDREIKIGWSARQPSAGTMPTRLAELAAARDATLTDLAQAAGEMAK